MSTRAVYTFSDVDTGDYHIYGHSDGYPSGAYDKLIRMIPFAWKLPRFDADDLAAAFVAGNKGKGGGNIYVSKHWNLHGDLAYRYEITKHHVNENNPEYYVKAFKHVKINTKDYELIFEGTLEEFRQFSVDKND